MIQRGDIRNGDIVSIDRVTVQRERFEGLYNNYGKGNDDINQFVKGLKFEEGSKGIVMNIVNANEGQYAFVNMKNGYCCIAEVKSLIRVNKFRKGDKITKSHGFSFTVGKGKIVTVNEFKIGVDKILFTIDELAGSYDQEVFIDCNGLTIGDLVEVINNGKEYTTYEKFYNDNKTDDTNIYVMSKNHSNGLLCKVMNIAEHESFAGTTLALVNTPDGDSAIFNVVGLKKVQDKIIEIVKGDNDMNTININENKKSKVGDRIIRVSEYEGFNSMPKYSIATISKVFSNKVYTKEYVGGIYMDEFKIVKDKAYSELNDKIAEQADKKENLRKINRKTIREQANKIASLESKLNKYKPKQKNIDDDKLADIINIVNPESTMNAYILGDEIVCELRNEFARVVSTGKAKKHPNDTFDLDTGLTLACIRAIKNEYQNRENDVIKNL